MIVRTANIPQSSVYVKPVEHKDVDGNFMSRPISWVLEPGKYTTLKKVLAVMTAKLQDDSQVSQIAKLIKLKKNHTDAQVSQASKKQRDEAASVQKIAEDQEVEFVEKAIVKFLDTGIMPSELTSRFQTYSNSLKNPEKQEQTISSGWLKHSKEIHPEFERQMDKHKRLTCRWTIEKSLSFDSANKAKEIAVELSLDNTFEGGDENPFASPTKELLEAIQEAAPLVALFNDSATIVEYFSKIDQVEDSVERVAQAREKLTLQVESEAKKLEKNKKTLLGV